MVVNLPQVSFLGKGLTRPVDNKPLRSLIIYRESQSLGMQGGGVLDLAAAVREGFARWFKGRIECLRDLAIGPFGAGIGACRADLSGACL
jgi:hypothetical protein